MRSITVDTLNNSPDLAQFILCLVRVVSWFSPSYEIKKKRSTQYMVSSFYMTSWSRRLATCYPSAFNLWLSRWFWQTWIQISDIKYLSKFCENAESTEIPFKFSSNLLLGHIHCDVQHWDLGKVGLNWEVQPWGFWWGGELAWHQANLPTPALADTANVHYRGHKIIKFGFL